MDGIYRVSGIASNIKKLKALFDTQTVPEALEKGKLLFNLSLLLFMFIWEIQRINGRKCQHQYTQFLLKLDFKISL